MSRYCEAVYQTKRRKSREVKVGKVGVGAHNPARIQSMTTSSTRDVDATVEQILRLADWGCEIARVTVQGKKEAEACEQIKNTLVRKGCDVPLVADIHFYPPAAMLVADFVDKIRVNPGNFVDKRASFQQLEYSDAEYAEEIARIEEKFSPLVLKCKALGRAMRIGTNHGSLSDRIMNRFGDSPEGMVESALEYARVCRAHDYHDIIFSMKSSNPQIMIQAYRLLAARMDTLGWDYPLHLGVTEAGEGEDGRVKSAMGIGTLLLDGLGDTIRVSLTEDPWYEIDPCRRLLQVARSYEGKGVDPFEETTRDFMAIQRRKGEATQTLPLHRDGSVMVALRAENLKAENLSSALGVGTPTAVDAVLVDGPATERDLAPLKEAGIPVLQALSLEEACAQRRQALFGFDTGAPQVLRITDEDPSEWEQLKALKPDLLFFAPSDDRLHRGRLLFQFLKDADLKVPVILNFGYSCGDEDLVIRCAAELGALLCDGLGDGICLAGPHGIGLRRRLGFQILQAARMRTFKTEFISCPSCGRTLFNLQDVSRQIRDRTGHLPGVKIAVMGCIVNGPGEMADADFGYVGSGVGKIDLYVGKERVEKNIPQEEGPDRLVELLKKYERWEEPQALCGSQADSLIPAS